MTDGLSKDQSLFRVSIHISYVTFVTNVQNHVVETRQSNQILIQMALQAFQVKVVLKRVNRIHIKTTISKHYMRWGEQ